MVVRVEDRAFSLAEEISAFTAQVSKAGAVVTFTGIVRDEDGTLDRMEIEHYPGMTEKALTKIEAEASHRWGLESSLILHRHGSLKPGEHIMMIATAARHRAAAFEAAEFLMDYLKSRAPFWKKEYASDGAAWVAAKDEDEQALTRW